MNIAMTCNGLLRRTRRLSGTVPSTTYPYDDSLQRIQRRVETRSQMICSEIDRSRCPREERRSMPIHRLCHLWVLCVLSLLHVSLAQEQQDPTTLNGGSILAMAGKNCVALAVDQRFGSGPALVNLQPRPVLVIRGLQQPSHDEDRNTLPAPPSLVAFTGLQGDVQTLQEELQVQVATKYARGLGMAARTRRPSSVTSTTAQSRRPWPRSVLAPRSVASVMSHILYSRKQSPYYVEPIVVGLQRLDTNDKDEDTYIPYLCSMDVIGAQSVSARVCCSGAATQSLYGMAEALWEPDLEAEDLVRLCGQAFLAALERDCLSGYGAVIYLLTSDGVTQYELASRND